jgi:hypothetical protein
MGGKEDNMANRNWASGGKQYSMHVSPVMIDCNFVVDNTQPSGISSLKGPCVSQVLMHSAAATPSMTLQDGTILVCLSDNYNGVFNVIQPSIVLAATGSDVKIDNSAMTAGVPYRISVVGNASLAKWQSIGLPAGVTPAIGVSFIASSNGGSGNALTSRVQAAITTSTVASIQLAADPNLTAAPSPSANLGYGAYMILQCRDFAGALVAPANGTKIALQMYMSNSSIQVAGE